MAAAYAQQGAKRPKVREPTRAVDSTEYFQGMERVEYTADAALTDGAAYRYYGAAERLHGRSVEEWLRLAVSLTAFGSDGSDWTGRPTFSRAWDDRSASLDNHKRCIKACFEFCTKLGLKYWTAFDSDLVPWSDTWEEYRANSEEIAEFIQENVQRTRVKPLWIAPDLHSHARYASGAATSPDATIFSQAAAQVKRALELAKKIDAECFLLWPYREGYEAFTTSDLSREMKLFAKLLKMTAEYKDRIPFRGQLLIMPFYENATSNVKCERGFVREDRDHRYMWDATSCMHFLRHFNLERSYKLCTTPGHQMFLASAYNMLGGVDINNAVDEFDHRTITEMMKGIIDQGSVLAGGMTLSVTPRRTSVEPRDLVCAYVNRIDSLARGLRRASRLIGEQLFSKHLQQRYVSYHSGFGARLAAGDVTLEECEENAKRSQHRAGESVASSRHEHWDGVLARYAESPPPARL